MNLYWLMRYGTTDEAVVLSVIKTKPRYKWSIKDFVLVNNQELKAKIAKCREIALIPEDFEPIPTAPEEIRTHSYPRKGDLVNAPNRKKNKNGVILWIQQSDDECAVKFFGEADYEDICISELEYPQHIGGRKVWTFK